jgi:hypothetical protein
MVDFVLTKAQVFYGPFDARDKIETIYDKKLNKNKI